MKLKIGQIYKLGNFSNTLFETTNERNKTIVEILAMDNGLLTLKVIDSLCSDIIGFKMTVDKFILYDSTLVNNHSKSTNTILKISFFQPKKL